MSHTIRLRGPWQVEPFARFVPGESGAYLTSPSDLPSSARVTMPADWAVTCGAEFIGRVRYHRVFQTPTGLDDGERVFLVVEPPRSWGEVSLSRKQLGSVRSGEAAFRFDITEMLEDHNRLEIVVEHPKLDEAGHAVEDVSDLTPGGLVGEVRLEIEE